MKRYIYLTFLCLFGAVFSSCTQDLLSVTENSEFSENTSYLGDNEYQIGMMIENSSPRTRAVDFTPGTGIRLNKIWIGIFDYKTGELVRSQGKDLDYRIIQAGNIYKNELRISFDDPTDPSEDGYVVACIANYADVNDANGDPLEGRLSGVTTWKEFNEIAIDATTAYSNMHNGIVPVLAGFVYDNEANADTDDTHIKIDQFEENKKPNDKDIKLSPLYKVNDVIIHLNKGKFDFSNKLLKLRRLVANINVNINLTDEAKKNLILTEVSYKRYNMPKAAYIIERRTTDCIFTNGGKYTPGNFAAKKNPADSPNWADMDPRNRYENDKAWIYGNTSGFSFQHFANKHWARNEVSDQNDREKCTKYGTYPDGSNKYYYHALVDEDLQNESYGEEDLENEGEIIEDFNNYASYFVIKMHLIDKISGKALEAEYTIHEGNTSDEIGNQADNYDEYKNDDGDLDLSKIKGNPKDFSVARNIDYTYNVFIAGVDHIYHNVGIGTDQSNAHYNGQGGKVWQFYYANDHTDIDGREYTNDAKDDREENPSINCHYNYVNGSFENPVPPTGGYYKHAIRIKNKFPDMSFRLYGYTVYYDRIDGYNYNFTQASFSYLDKLWPPSVGMQSHYFQDYDELMEHSTEIPAELQAGLKIYYSQDEDKKDLWENKGPMTAVDLIKEINDLIEDNGGIPDKYLPLYFDIEIAPTNINKDLGKNGEEFIPPSTIKNDYLRAIYITDRNGIPDEVDGCTSAVNVFAAAQYPKVENIVEKTKLQIPRVNLDIKYNYNILKPYIADIKIPIMTNIIESFDDYHYELRIGESECKPEDTINFSEFGGERDDKELNYVYQIPMHKFPWSEGDVYLKVISDKPDLYEDSNLTQIGTVKLLDHAPWYNNEQEWSSLLDTYSSDSNQESEGEFLKIYTSDTAKTMRAVTENNIRYLKTSGGACTILIKNIYKKCKLLIKARTQDVDNIIKKQRHRSVLVTVNKTKLDIVDLTTGKFEDVYITIDGTYSDWNEGSNEVYINPDGGGIDIQYIEILPY